MVTYTILHWSYCSDVHLHLCLYEGDISSSNRNWTPNKGISYVDDSGNSRHCNDSQPC